MYSEAIENRYVDSELSFEIPYVNSICYDYTPL